STAAAAATGRTPPRPSAPRSVRGRACRPRSPERNASRRCDWSKPGAAIRVSWNGGEPMGVVGKAPGWQRAVSALLTLGFAWAFATRALDGGLGAWPEVVVMLVALYGG